MSFKKKRISSETPFNLHWCAIFEQFSTLYHEAIFESSVIISISNDDSTFQVQNYSFIHCSNSFAIKTEMENQK